MKGQNFPEYSGAPVLPGEVDCPRWWWKDWEQTLMDVSGGGWSLMISQLKPSAPSLFHSLGVLTSWWSSRQQWLPRSSQTCFLCRNARWQSAGWPVSLPPTVWLERNLEGLGEIPLQRLPGKGPRKPIFISHGSSSPSSPACRLWASVLCQAL